jgi:hypothetical protein
MRLAHSLPHAFTCDVDMVNVCGACRRAVSAGWPSTRVGRCWRPCPRRAGRSTYTHSRPCPKTGVAPCTISSPRRDVALHSCPRSSSPCSSAGIGRPLLAAQHLYTLNRGLTNATIQVRQGKGRGSSSCLSWTCVSILTSSAYPKQDISFSADSRWAAFTTTHGTTHIYAICPWGGAATPSTHLPAVVENMKVCHAANLHAHPRRRICLTIC